VRILLVGDGEQLARRETCRPSDAFFVRGRGEEHHRHLSHQGVFCRSCELGLHVAVQANLNVFRSNTLSRRLQFRQKLLRRTLQPTLLTPEVEQTLYRRVWLKLTSSLTAAPQDRPHLESEIRKAHVICVVYSIDNPGSFDRIPTYWLPHFRQLGVNVIFF
jgi:hypothetical protein